MLCLSEDIINKQIHCFILPFETIYQDDSDFLQHLKGGLYQTTYQIRWISRQLENLLMVMYVIDFLTDAFTQLYLELISFSESGIIWEPISGWELVYKEEFCYQCSPHSTFGLMSVHNFMMCRVRVCQGYWNSNPYSWHLYPTL